MFVCGRGKVDSEEGRIHWQNAQIHELDQNYKVLLEIHKLKQT